MRKIHTSDWKNVFLEIIRTDRLRKIYVLGWKFQTLDL